MTTTTAQCPACATRFRVSEPQLQAAGAVVRCGRCMQIFNALDGEPLSEAQLSPPPEDKAESQGTFHFVDQDDPAQPDDEPERDPLSLLDSLSTVGHDFEHHQPPSRPRRWPWLFACAFPSVLLLWQLAWWQMPALLSGPAAEQVAGFCQRWQLNCHAAAAPTESQLGPISAQKLLVRKHPERADALIVDTLLLNNGDSGSDFPALFLRFSDLGGRTLASRAFQPREYLTGELSRLTSLAAHQPIHVVMEIRDPGPQAVNYQLELLPGKALPRPR